jgi:hypothetical protein
LVERSGPVLRIVALMVSAAILSAGCSDTSDAPAQHCVDGGLGCGDAEASGGGSGAPTGGSGGSPTGGSGGSPTGGSGGSGSGGSPVVGDCTVELLPYAVVDAEYSVALDRVIIVSANPHRLRVVDGASGAETTVELPHAPVAVSVGPGGTDAAVAHDNFVSWVDLTAPQLIRTATLFSDAHDVVLGTDGYAYVLPATDQWTEVHSVDLNAGVDRTTTGAPSVYERSNGVLHPTLGALYVAQPLSPSRTERYDIVDGLATPTYRSRGNACEQLWISVEDNRLYGACGDVLRASNTAEEDLVSIGELFSAFDRTVHHIVQRGSNVFVVRRNTSGDTGLEDVKIQVYSAADFSFVEEREVPCISTPSRNVRAHARFAFPARAGAPLVVLAQADSASPIPGNWGIVTLP